MKYSPLDIVAIGRRDTAGWRAVSWQARGLSLEITRHLDAAGEVSLGRRGLEALGALLGAPWAEIRPYIEELLEDGRLEHDTDRRVLRDPQHTARQEAARATLGLAPCSLEEPRPAPARGPRRALSSTPAAIRQRELRARRRAEAARATAQLALPVTSRDDRDADATCRTDVTVSRDVTPEVADLAAIWELPPCDMSQAFASPSLSPISDLPKEKKERSRAPCVTLDGAHVPPEAALVATELRPDLHDGIVGRSWRKFAARNSGKWKALDKVLERWTSWILDERAPAAEAPPAPLAAAEPAASRPRIARAPAPPLRTLADLDEAGRQEFLAASARLASGDFARAS